MESGSFTVNKIEYGTDAVELRQSRIAVSAILGLLLGLSALCAGLPKTDPYGPDSTLTTSIDTGDTAWTIVASALGTVLLRLGYLKKNLRKFCNL